MAYKSGLLWDREYTGPLSRDKLGFFSESLLAFFRLECRMHKCVLMWVCMPFSSFIIIIFTT